MEESKEQYQVPLMHLLKIGGPILLAIIAGTFAITKYSSQQSINALNTRLEHVNQCKDVAEEKLHRLKSSIASSNSSQDNNVLPQVTLEASKDTKSTQELASRITELEDERDQLIQQFSQKAIDSLDPNSELPVLLKQLSSDRLESRQEAINGLFLLKDYRSYAPLVKYFIENTEEATRSHRNYSIWDWYRLFFELNPQSTLELLVNTLDVQDDHMSYVAYERLIDYVTSVELIDTCKPLLESLALRSTNSSARTRAKVMLSLLMEKKDKLLEKERLAAEAPSDKRSQKEILLRIERILKSMKTHDSNQIEPDASANPGETPGPQS